MEGAWLLEKVLSQKLRANWRWMLAFPWRHTGPETDRSSHWLAWLLGWVWTILGLALGALVAPSIGQRVGLTDETYLEALDITLAVLIGFLVQLLGWLLFTLNFFWFVAWPPVYRVLRAGPELLKNPHSLLVSSKPFPRYLNMFRVVGFWLAGFIPGAATFYAFARYLAWVGPGQALVTTGFVGGLFVKVVLVPTIKALVVGVGLKAFMKWLRKDERPKP